MKSGPQSLAFYILLLNTFQIDRCVVFYPTALTTGLISLAFLLLQIPEPLKMCMENTLYSNKEAVNQLMVGGWFGSVRLTSLSDIGTDFLRQ